MFLVVRRMKQGKGKGEVLRLKMGCLGFCFQVMYIEWKKAYLSWGSNEHYAGIFSNFFFHFFPYFLMRNYKDWPDSPVPNIKQRKSNCQR